MRNPEKSQIPAIALTALSTNLHRDRALEAGFDPHLSKRVDFDELIKVVSESINVSSRN